MEQIKGVLKFVTEFSDTELLQICSLLVPRKAVHGEILLSSGEISQEFYFVSKGCIRTYFIDRKGIEKTRYIMPENYLGTALTSFVSGEPSFELIDVLSDSELYYLSRDNFYRLNEEMPAWKTFYQKILEMAYSFQTRKIESIMTLSAQQRYDQAMKENPQLFQRVSNRVLASYLDMTPETLSRLKSR